MVARTIS